MHALTRLSLNARAVVALLTLTILGVGLFSVAHAKQELYPSLQMNGAYIAASYPGASPSAVEHEVTKPLEDAVRAVDGVSKVTSVSASNVSTVQVEWEYGRDNATMESEIRAAANGVNTLPKDVKPEVMVGNLDSIPVVALAVSSDLPGEELSKTLKSTAASTLKQVPGVASVEVSGAVQRNVVITTRPADLAKCGLSSAQLQQALAPLKASMPVGDIETDGRRINVSVGEGLNSLDAVKAIRLQGKDKVVSVADVADVADVPVESETISRVNGKPATTIAVMKKQDASTVSVAHGVDEKLPEIATKIGANTTFTTSFSQAPYIESSMHNLAVEGGLGLLMAIVVIMVFLLSLRSTLITAVSIPLSLLIAMIALHFGQQTLNIMTLAAMTVAVGRVVDDSIVVIENIKRHMALGQPFGVDLIVSSVREVATAVTASTLTTVAVFLPLGLVGGMTGEMFRPFAVTISVALLASLLVSLTVVPVLVYWWLRPTAKQQAQLASAPALASHESEVTGLQKAYLPALHFSIKHPLIVALLGFAIFVGSLGLATQLKTELFGDTGQGALYVTAKMPAGASLAQKDALAKQVEKVLAADPAVENYDTSIGGGSMMGSSSAAASFNVKLKPHEKAAQVGDRLRPAIKALKGAEFEVMTDTGGGANNALTVEVQGEDAAAVEKGAEQVTAMLKGAHMAEVKSDLGEKETTLQVKLRAEDAARYGHDQSTVGPAVLEAMRGTPVGSMTIDDAARDIVLRSRTPLRTKAELETLELPVTMKQTADEQKRLSDQVTAEQEASADKQQAKSLDQLDEQIGKVPEQRKQAREQLDKLLDQLKKSQDAAEKLDEAPATPPAMAAPAAAAPVAGAPNAAGQAGGAPAAGADPAAAAQAQQQAQQQAEAQAKAAAAAQAKAQAKATAEAKKQAKEQISELKKAIEQARKGLKQVDEQEEQLKQSKADAQDAAAKAEDMKARTEAIQKATGKPVTLKQVADVVEVPVVANIRHTDGAKTVTVTGVPAGDLGTSATAASQGLKSLALPSGVTASMGGASAEQNEAFAQLGLAMAIAVAIVYMVMVATFRSLLQPLILLVSVPFAATGAIAGLLITNTALGVPAMIGLLMLIGIVVTNAIVLIDLINTFRQQGSSIQDAVVHGARLRLRPIIMTALATIMALVPMASGFTGSGLFISKSLAIVVIGGLVSSTLLTLLIIPALYRLVEGFRESRATRRAARRALPVEPAVDAPGA